MCHTLLINCTDLLYHGRKSPFCEKFYLTHELHLCLFISPWAYKRRWVYIRIRGLICAELRYGTCPTASPTQKTKISKWKQVIIQKNAEPLGTESQTQHATCHGKPENSGQYKKNRTGLNGGRVGRLQANTRNTGPRCNMWQLSTIDKARASCFAGSLVHPRLLGRGRGCIHVVNLPLSSAVLIPHPQSVAAQ